MRIPVLVLLLASSILLVLASSFILHAADPPECATCEDLINAPQTGIFVLVNDVEESNRYLNIIAYYENLSASPSRQNLSNTILLVELTSPTGTYELFRTYTNQNGTARFRFSDYDGECLNFKVLYCPYCVPPELDCEGFKQCVEFGHLDTTATNAQDVDQAVDAVVLADSELNPNKYLPSLGTATWCPPPPALAATPALCFPLILIFSLLSGAMYLTGRNPFAGFNIGGMRTGQHIKYQARGRGFSFSFTQLAMAAMSVGEAVQTARKQGGGALVKREKDAANARGLGGLYGTDSKGKSGFAIGVRQQIGAYQAGRATQATGATGAAGKGKGKGGAATPGRGGSGSSTTSTGGGASMAQGAGGMQTSLTGGGGTSGQDILGGKSVTIGPFSGHMLNSSSILRILTFVALNTTLGRAIDALHSANTWNAEAGRGRNLFDDAFADRAGRVVDSAATLAGLRGPNGGTMVRILEGSGEGRMVETMPVPRGRPPVPEGQTEYAISVPRGEGAGQSTTGIAIIRINTNPDSPTRGQVLSVENTMRVPAVDAQGRPIMAMVPVLDKAGQPVMVPVLDKAGQPVMGDNGQPRMEQQMRAGTEQRMDTMIVRASAPTAESNFQPKIEMRVPDTSVGATSGSVRWVDVPPAQLPAVQQSFSQIMQPLGSTFQPGVIAAPFVDSYNTHMQGIQALQDTIRSESSFLKAEEARAIASELERNPEARDAVHQARYDVSAESVSRLGIPETNLRTGDTGDLFAGVQRGDSDLPGHTRSAYETVVITVHEADESAGPRRIGVPSLTSLAGQGGVSALAQNAGLTDERNAAASTMLPGVLGSMSVSELAHATPADLQSRILHVPPGANQEATTAALNTLNQSRASQGLPPVTMDDVRAASQLAPSVSSIATDFTRSITSQQGFGNLDQSGRSLSDRVLSADLSTISSISNSGHLLQAEGTGALIATRPELAGSYRIPDTITQAAREYNALEQVTRVASNPNPVAVAEPINQAVFDYASAVMVNRARGDLQDSEYSQAGRGLDSGMHHSAVTSSFGDLPATSPNIPGLPPGTIPSIESVEEQRRAEVSRHVAEGDYGTARALIGQAAADYNTAARAARALGDEDRARTLETAAAGYQHAFQQVDFCEGDTRSRGGARSPNAGPEVLGAINEYFPLTHPPPPPPPPTPSPGTSGQPTPPAAPPETPPTPRVGSEIEHSIYTVVDSSMVAGAVDHVRGAHGARRSEDMIQVKEHIEERLPRDKRPPQMQDTARAMPLTPTIPGINQTPYESG